MQNKHYCFLLLIISCLILSCSDNEHLSIDINKKELPRKNGVSNTYYIGFDLRWDPVEDVKFYLPLLHHLSSETGYNFKFKIPRSYQENIYMLGNGSVDLSLMGSVSCMIANIQFGAEPIVVGLNSNGKPYYKSVIIKKSTDRSIKSIANLKGKKIAFGNMYSTQGYLIPRKLLEDHGISLTNINYEFSESHRDAANKLINGFVDAATIQDKLGFKLANEGSVTIITASKIYPSSTVCVSNKIPLEARRKIKNALLNFYSTIDSNSIKLWQNTEMSKGFIDADKVDFDEIRKLITAYYGIK